jgi:SAM-dependent methyltransferase
MSVTESIRRALPDSWRPFFRRLRRLVNAPPPPLPSASQPISLNGRDVARSQQWFLSRNDDERQEREIGDFRAFIRKAIAKTTVSMEIGPSFAPILPKRDGYNVRVLDHDDQAGLVAKYTSHGVAVSKIEPVDFVWRGEKIGDLVNERFDAIVASHVIEHAPDFIQFLNDCSGILNPTGRIYLLIPDKRYCFDFLQPVSDVAKIMGDHRVRRTRHSFESFYRLTQSVLGNGGITWGQGSVPSLAFVHGDPNFVLPLARSWVESDTYQDVHENYFTPMSFAMIVDELFYLGETDLELRILSRARGCEFLAVAEKVTAPEPMSAEAFLERKMAAYSVQLEEELERLMSAPRRG